MKSVKTARIWWSSTSMGLQDTSKACLYQLLPTGNMAESEFNEAHLSTFLVQKIRETLVAQSSGVADLHPLRVMRTEPGDHKRVCHANAKLAGFRIARNEE
jgi:hypothetical protein